MKKESILLILIPEELKEFKGNHQNDRFKTSKYYLFPCNLYNNITCN